MTDFTCMPESIRSAAHGVARKAGVELATVVIPLYTDALAANHGVLLQAYAFGSTWRPNLTRFDREKLYKKHVANNPR